MGVFYDLPSGETHVVILCASAPRCLCASLPLAVFILTAYLLLAPLATYAGTYSSPTYSGGMVTSLKNAPSGYLPDGLDTLTGTHGWGWSTFWSASNSPQNIPETEGGTDSGPVTVKFSWQAAYPGEPFPQSVLVLEHSVVVGAGNIRYGTGQILMATSSTGLPQNAVIYYSAVTPAADGSITITRSPQATVTITSGPSGLVNGQNSVHYSANIYPITLAAPDPKGHPELGDGKNQFTYDGESPDGYLAVPASANAVGASAAATAWLLPHVALSVSPVMQTGAQPFQWLSSGSQMYVYTPGSYPNGSGYPSAAFLYKGLPPTNTYFGNHVMTMNVNGAASQTANYQLFFNGAASNWPGSDKVTPNWYDYYSGVYTPFSAQSPAVYQKSSASGDVSYADPSSPFSVHVRDSAYSTSYNTSSLRVFDINPTFPKYVRFIGILTFPTGIMQFVHETAHERGHQYLFQSGTDGPIYTNSKDPLDFNSSEDGDIVSDNWEAGHHLNAGASDTTHAYAGSGPNDASDGDGELLADVQALAVVFNQLQDWQQDWADGGVQKGPQSYLVPNSSTGVAPGFSLTFQPASAGATGSISYTGSAQQVTTLSQIAAINQSVNGANSGPLVTSLSIMGP